MDGKATWKYGLSFDGTGISGFTLPMGTSVEKGGLGDGFSPMELVLVGLAGCTAMDVISILEKKRQNVKNFEVRVHGERAADHPKVYTSIQVEYVVTGEQIDRSAVERAVDLSVGKYCSVSAMLAKTAVIEHVITVVEG